MCILNGTPVLDNFTCINACGKSIVDYMLIHQETLNLVSKCDIMSVHELLHNYKSYNLISENCKTPNHFILSMTFSQFIPTKFIPDNTCSPSNVEKNNG